MGLEVTKIQKYSCNQPNETAPSLILSTCWNNQNSLGNALGTACGALVDGWLASVGIRVGILSLPTPHPFISLLTWWRPLKSPFSHSGLSCRTSPLSYLESLILSFELFVKIFGKGFGELKIGDLLQRKIQHKDEKTFTVNHRRWLLDWHSLFFV